MPDQELTALKIRIEADVKAALDKLDALSAKLVSVSSQVVSSVTRINTALKTIDGKVIDLKLNVQGQREVDALKKQLEGLRAAAGNAVSAPASNLPVVQRRQEAVVPSESEISSFVSAVKSGVAVSIEELKKFRSALTALFESKQLRLGVDNTEVLQLKKDLEFLNGFINASKRDIKVRVSTEGDQEIKNKLNNLQKDYVLRIIPSFNDADFNKLLTEIQNKRINLTFEDVSDAIKEEIRQVESITANLPIGADTSAYDAKVNALKNSLTKIQAIQVNANTQPAELSLKQLQQRATTILAKQQELKLRAQILLPSGELSALQATKKRLEADRIRLKGTAEFGDINANLEAVKRRIAELNSQGVKLQVTTGEIISQQSVTKVNQAIAAVKDLKRTAGDIRIEYRGNGLERLNGQANQTVRNFEQIIRDTPSFAISAQQGFIAISNNIGPLTDSFGRLAQEAKASGKSITSALAGALGGWNAIGIAISLAVTAVAVFGKEIFSASKDVEKLKDKFKEIKDIIDNTKFVVPEAVGNTAGDRLEAASLAATLSNANKPLQERAKALARLQQLDKELFAGFTVGQKNYDSLGDAVDKYTAKIEKQAAQEARLQDISKKTAERNKLEVQLEGVNKELDVLANTVTFIDPFSGEQLKGGGKRVDELRKQAKDIQTLINNLNQSIAQQTGEVFAFSIAVDTSDATGGSTSLDDELKRILQSRRDRLESELKNLSTISERYFTIQQEIASLDLQIKNIGEVNREVKSNNFEGYQNALEGINIAAKAAGVELTNLKLTLADPAFFAAPNIEPFAKLRQDAINAKLEIDKLFRSGSLTEEEKLKAEAELEFNIQADVLNAQKELDSYQLLIKTGIAPQLEPVVPDQTIPRLPELADDAQMLRDMGYGLEDWNQKLRNSLKPMEEFQQRLADLNKEIANIVASGVADLFGNLFDALNEDGKLTFEEIGNAVRDFVQDLIKAIGKLLIFKAIISAFGLDSVAAIAGPLVRARKFATGGVVTGPTFGLVGEAGPEAVLPLSFLNNLFTNVGGDANLQARVSGQDLLFLMERASKANNRYF